MPFPVRKFITTSLLIVLLMVTRGTASAQPEGDEITAEAALVQINHETGSLTGYSGAITDAGDLSVTTSAAMAVTSFGLQVVLDDTTNIYAFKALGAPSTSGVLRASLYVDPNSLRMANLDELSYAYFVAADGVTTVGSMQLFFLNGYRIRGAMLDDAGTHNHTQAFSISDGPHRVEIRITRASSSTARNGSYETWIDGSAQVTLAGIDNYDRFSSFKTVSLGANSTVNKIRGIYYLDELIVSDSGAGQGGPNPGSSGCTAPGAGQGCKAFLPILIR